MRVHLTKKSRNDKTGPIPVSTTEKDSCPPSCEFNSANQGGCYAEYGPLMLHWNKVSKGERGMPFPEFLAAIEGLPNGQLWRHNQAGDLPGEGEYLDHGALMNLAKSAQHTRGFTFTHKLSESALESVYQANVSGFTVNLSANGLGHADKLADTGKGPVVTVLPEDQTTNTKTPAGREVIVCPATQKDDVSCATCGLCQKWAIGRNERPIIGFPAHGVKRQTATTITYQND